MKTSLKKKESVDLPGIHEIAIRDHINRSVTHRVFILLTPGRRQIQIYTSQLPVTSISPSRSPRAETHDIEMAPKKDKSKVEDEAVVNLSTGWRKSKISQAALQELENMGLLQSQAVIQWRAGEGEEYPFEGTLETVIFRDFVERGLVVPVSKFFHALLQFWGINL